MPLRAMPACLARWVSPLSPVALVSPISKWSYQIRHAEDVAWAVSRAFYIARTGRPGPVVLDFAKNAQVEEIDWEPMKVNFIRSYVPYPKLDAEAVRQAAELINNAKKPLALVGQGVELGNAQSELVRFLEKADIPAGRTMLGLSALPSNHPLNAGMLGMHGNYAVNLKEQECDVLIAIGMRFSDRVTGNLKTYAKQAKIIHLDIDPSEIDKNVKTDVAIVADCKESLPALTALVGKADHSEWRASFKELDEKERTKVIEPAIHPKEGPLRMGEVVHMVSEKSADDTILVTDVGQNQRATSNTTTSAVSAPAVVSARWATACPLPSVPPSALPAAPFAASWATVASRCASRNSAPSWSSRPL